MDATGPIAQRFPLIARPRPPCTALSARVNVLAALADRAVSDGDLAAAASVHNQAALLASDCGQPDLARDWCHRHARAYLDRPELHTDAARYALEPLVNLARLHIRAGNGQAAIAVLDTLYHAILTRTDTTIDGIGVPAAALTRTTESHHELSKWLWGVQLADGTRALTTTGRWRDAETRLRQHNGIGRRMLDGRQVAVIARATSGDHSEALHLLNQTERGEPWEDAVIACLTALTQYPSDLPVDQAQRMVSRYGSLPTDPTLVVFRTRLGLSIIDAIDQASHPATLDITQCVIRDVLHCGDGYAARDLLGHCAFAAAKMSKTVSELKTVLDTSGLDRPLPASVISRLEAALAATDPVLTSSRRSESRPPRCTAVSSVLRNA